jgi:uncharacterized protein (TIGR02466 family)
MSADPGVIPDNGPEVASFFAVPIAHAQLPGADELCAGLGELFIERADQGDAYRHQKRIDTMHGDLFESRFDLFSWPDPPVRRLAKGCHDALARLVQKLNGYSEVQMGQLRFSYHAWFHVTRKFGYQGQHNHPNASWSGIFCVDPGDEIPERPDSGLVRFHDPRTHIDMYSDAGNKALQLPYSMGSCDWRHRRGQLVIFPSYLRHEIYPYVGERPRIVVAFNCWIHRLGQVRHATGEVVG